jgi:hypothetical protein
VLLKIPPSRTIRNDKYNETNEASELNIACNLCIRKRGIKIILR